MKLPVNSTFTSLEFFPLVWVYLFLKPFAEVSRRLIAMIIIAAAAGSFSE